MGEGQSHAQFQDVYAKSGLAQSYFEEKIAERKQALAAGGVGPEEFAAASGDPADPQLYEPALLSQLVLLLGTRPRRSLLLSDLGALLPANLRQGVKEKGGLRSWLQKYPELFQVSGLPGKESVTLLILGGGSGPGGAEVNGMPAPVGPQHASVAELEATKKQEEEDNESAIQLRGLPYRATMQDVKNFLGHHTRNLKNDSNAVQLVLNRDGRPSGFGRCQFRTADQARRCRDELHMQVMEVSGGGRADRDRGDRYVEIFLYSERPNKLRFKKTAFGGEYDHEAEQEIEALGVTKQKVLDECRQHMGMPGKSPLLLSMLGVALSPGSRLYLKKTDQGLKHFLAQHPQEFYVDGSKGREVITYLRAPGNKLGLPEFAVDPAQVPASAGALPPKANMEVPKVTLQLPSNEPASDCMTAESPKNMGNRYLPTSPLPPGSVGSNCGNLGTRRGNASNGPATGNLSDLGGFPPTPGWDDMVPPESPKATNLLPTDQTPVCTNHPGMQTPSDWGTPWDSVKPWDVRHPAKLGGQADLNSMGAGPSTDNGATGPNMFTQAWSAWGMPPPAMWPGQAGAFSAGSDASQEALQNLLQMSGGMPSADPSQGVPAALLSYLAMGNPQGGLPNATWMDMNQLHAMQSGQPQALAPQQSEHMADHDAPAKMEASEAPAAIRLRGLPYEAGEQDILAWMAKYDVVDRIMECKQAVRIYSKNNGKPMGLAVIAMNSKEDAEFVRQALHGQYMGNRYIEVFPHLEGEAGTDKATVQGSTAGATGGTGACNGGVQGRTEMRVEAEAFEGAGDTGGSGGSGGMPQGMMSNMPMWPGAPGTMGCMSGCMPYAGGDAQIDPFSQVMDYMKGDAFAMPMQPPVGDGSGGRSSGFQHGGQGRAPVHLDSM